MTDQPQNPPAVPTPAASGTSPHPSFQQELARVRDFSGHMPNVGEALANLANFVPGFAGYKSAEDRRISDKELRAVIGVRLANQRGRLDRVVDQLSRAGNLADLPLIDQSSRRLEKLIDRMRFADYGYAAVFDRIQLGDAELARLYSYDAALVGDVGAFDDAIAAVEQAASDSARLRAALAKLDAVTAEFDRRFEARKHLFDSLPTP